MASAELSKAFIAQHCVSFDDSTMAWRRAAGKSRLAAANERAKASESSSNDVVYSCNFMAEVGPSGGTSRRKWMEMERELREQDSDSEDVMPRNVRTDDKYDCLDCRPWHNLRYVKWGPNGGEWEKGYAPVVAAGPPLEQLRWGEHQCWLCNATLQQLGREWTRPAWMRKWTKPVGPYEQVVTEEPPSQLGMTIYCWPNGCDADDALQVLLDQKDHTGPKRGSR